MIPIFNNLPEQSRATFLMIAALFMFTVMGICIRISATHLPVIEVVFFRNFLAVLILLPLLARVGFSVLHMQRPKLFFLRAAINAVGKARYHESCRKPRMAVKEMSVKTHTNKGHMHPEALS